MVSVETLEHQPIIKDTKNVKKKYKYERAKVKAKAKEKKRQTAKQTKTKKRHSKMLITEML